MLYNVDVDTGSVVKYATKRTQRNIQEGSKLDGDVTENLKSNNPGDFFYSSLKMYYVHLIKRVTKNAASKTES
jgi:hypothetical protein